jgi:hypothetical protein
VCAIFLEVLLQLVAGGACP